MEALKELLYSIGSFCAGILRGVLEWFLGLSLLNKIIVLNTFTAFLAITLPIAKYFIFESWFGINNPLAVYLIIIAFIMFITVFFSGLPVMAGRVIVNIWYLISVIYIAASHTVSHAPYVLSFGYFFNLLAPMVYMVVSVLVYLSGDN